MLVKVKGMVVKRLVHKPRSWNTLLESLCGLVLSYQRVIWMPGSQSFPSRYSVQSHSPISSGCLTRASLALHACPPAGIVEDKHCDISGEGIAAHSIRYRYLPPNPVSSLDFITSRDGGYSCRRRSGG
jgi:hypothetical protein